MSGWMNVRWCISASMTASSVQGQFTYGFFERGHGYCMSCWMNVMKVDIYIVE
jgi:hypothetical protein